ncbi:hypothetical protein Egran_01751 [Elaphomyces granulatus]|uniref:Dipeptidyl-peptidase V n=1 Tax=Elaphomyces granulatus TaxID=519963 RepID=A0A232M273_9EURO|nr:hypothetical protein Egran_01751 [Elaphomyces granulatus]
MTVRQIKFTPEVLLSAPRRSAGIPNAGGTHLLYTESTYCFKTHAHTNEIRVLDITTSSSILITGDASASNPQWLGDHDKLVWLKEKENGNTSFIVGDVCGVERPYTAGTVPGPVSNLKTTVIESGTKVGFAVSGKANPDGSLYNPKDAKKPLSSARLYTSLFVRHWDSYAEPQKNTIWYGLLQITPSSASGPRKKFSLSGLTNLMAVSGLEGVESPIPPFGGADHFDISPAAIVFVAKDPVLNPSTHTSCICYYCPMFSWVEVGIREAKTCQLSNLQGAMTSPALSSDGSSIVLLVMKEDGYESDQNRIVYVPNPWDGKMIEIFSSTNGLGQWSLSPSSVSWSNDDKSWLIHVEELGRGALYQLPLADIEHITPASLTRLTHTGYVTDVIPAAGKLFVSSNSLVENSLYTVIDPAAPDDVTVISSSSRGGAALGLSTSQVDEIWYPGADGNDVHAWVVKPSRFDSKKKYPLAYLIHGGPQGAWNDQWSTRWNPAVFAEQGYVVITPNPTGSTGYGQAFTDAIRGSWGGLPYIDLVKGMEYIEKHLSYVDVDRAVALGASYGGYMVNWIQGHPLGRKFKALVTHDGIFNMVSQLASDEQYFPTHDMGGPLWKVPEEWAKWDPSRFTRNWATPHLIIHNELDYRLTIAEGLAAFNVLQMKAIDSAFLTFPDENHWVLNTENSLVWHQTVLDWINKHVGLPPISVTSSGRTSHSGESEQILKSTKNFLR